MDRGLWRELRMPVDVPQMNVRTTLLPHHPPTLITVLSQILAAARLDLQISSDIPSKSDAPPPIYAGQPIPAAINIYTSFHWGSSHGDEERQYVMQYDVEEMVREWLISGRKRGNFVAKVRR